ncbi:MAG: aldo/keto reductase [Alkalispirochaetaceae bacterium]
MEQRYLGKTGMKVSELCLGTMTFGRETDAGESKKMLDRFLEAGGTFLDTANVYSRGISEDIIGDWLKDKSADQRQQLILATKGRFPMGEGPNDTGASRKYLLYQIEESLRRLNTDYVDLYQVHCWDRGTELAETLDTLDSLVQQGVVRYIGASNYTGRQLQKAIDLQRSSRLEQFRSLQPQYSLLCRTTEWELIPLAQDEGLGVLPWSPLRGGWLSGKYQRGMEQPPAETRVARAEKSGGFEAWSKLNRESTWRVIDALNDVVQESGKTHAQVALRWLLQRPAVTAPIIGVRTMDHLEQAIGATGWELTPAQMDTLTEASEPEKVYPWDFVEWAQDGR